MRFDTAGKCEEVIWCMRLAEMIRGENRVILNRHFNGAPPFDPVTAEENGVQVNVHFLEGVNHLSQARRQWNRAFLGAGNYFNVRVDGGPPHKQRSWSGIITKHINRALKRSAEYLEYHRSQGANSVLHGIAPSCWESKTSPFLVPLMVDDLLVPSETLTSFANLDHFAVYRQWSPAQLYKLTHGPKIDPGWNMPMVDGLLKGAAQEYVKNAYSVGYQYQPEKVEEYIKQDIGFWGSDAPPTIDVWDFYFREYTDGEGWYRRIVVDTAISNESRQAFIKSGTRPKIKPHEQGFLYTSKKRKFTDSLRQIIHCQFGDTSAVAPFRYHSVRSLGYMLFGVCELQNRLRCKFSESVFEQLMWFFRVGGEQDFTRLKKALFSHMGVIPNGISFVPATERFKPDYQLVSLLLQQNQQLMGQSSASFTQDLYQGSESKEMTATETMARVNQTNALVSGMLNLAYGYEVFQYRETCRRFCLKDSKHLIVKKFRKDCLHDGVPEEMLDADRWDIEPERVLGAGNKQLETAQASQLLQMRPTLSPQAQSAVDHIAIEAFTDDPALAEQLVPMEGRPELSQSKQEAQHAIGTIMMGGIVQFGPEDNRREVIETLIMEMALIIGRQQQMGPPTMQMVSGLQNLSMHIAQILPLVEADPGEQERAKEYADQLGKLDNITKGWMQQIQQAEKAGAAQNGNGAADTAAELQAKLEAQKIAAAAKAANSRESHAQKTAQRQVQFEQQQRQQDEAHEAELRRMGQTATVENLNETAMTAAEIERERAKSAAKPAESD